MTVGGSWQTGRWRALALMASDAACLVTCWLIVAVGYKLIGFGNYQLEDYIRLWPMVPLFLGVNAVSRTYHGNWLYPAMPLAPPEEFRRLFLGSVVLTLGLMAVLGFARSNLAYSRLVIFVSGALTACMVQAVRDLVRAFLKRHGWLQMPVILVGEGAVAEKVERALSASAYVGFDVRHFVGDPHEIVAEAKRRKVKLLLSCHDPRLFRVQMDDFVKWFHHVEYLPSAEAFPVADGRVISIGGICGLEMVNQSHMKFLRWEKGLLDRALSLIIFLFALPLFAIIPPLIKLTSRGPVFYRANRLGKKGRPIRVWKFRSMYADADSRLQALLDSDPTLRAEFERDFKLKNDPRVTPLGHFMRKTSIDELPQLFNVFAGDMALVGPRPIVGKEVAYYGKAYGIFASVKPGITGLWQASGRSDCSYDERVALDVHYVLNWSLWMDLWIVFRTVAAVLKMKGSY